MEKVTMVFAGAGRLGGDEYDVEIQRVPLAGDLVAGPDEFGTWRVETVTFDYGHGFIFEPTPRVALVRGDSA